MALEWLDKIERRANAATPGPWFLRDITFADSGDGDGKLEWEIVNDAGYPIFGPFWAWEDDAVFMRQSRTDVPLLCRAVRELYNALSSLVSAVGGNEFIGPITLVRQGTPAAWALAEAQDVLRRWRRGGA